MVIEALNVRGEDQLVAHARRGEQWAWKALFERDRQRVYQIAYRILLDREEALDVVQDTFCKAFCNMDRLLDDAGWPAWLRTIGARLALSRTRRVSRLRRWLGRKADEAEMDRVAAPAQPACASVEQRELVEALQVALERLSPKQRAVATFYFEEDLTPGQIAVLLGMKPVTVRAHLHRTRRFLKKHLGRLNLEVEQS